MAMQAQLYSDNIVFPECGSQDQISNAWCGGGGSGGNGSDGRFNQFCFSLQQEPQLQQQQQQLQQLQNQQPWNQSLYINNRLVPSSNRESMVFYQSMVSQVEKQGHEIDQLISLQNERLRLLLQEQSKQQVTVLIKKIEAMASVLLNQKDEEILKATNKTMELQNMLKKLEMHSQAWRRVALQNEALVVSLNKKLEQLREQAPRCFNNGVDDAESRCEIETDEENICFAAGLVNVDHGQEQDEERTRKMMTTTTTTTAAAAAMVCKCCNSRSTCTLFLPCRHLCSCKDCASFLESCPVCRAEKKDSIEALIS